MEDLKTRWETLDREVKAFSRDLERQKGARDTLQRSRDTEEKARLAAVEEATIVEQASTFLAAEIVERRMKAIEAIESIGTSALRTVYGPDYRLRFNTFDEKREKGERAGFKMELQIESVLKGRQLTTGLVGERGGGLIEVTAFGLRIAALEWMQYAGPLVLDEAWKSMSADEKLESVADFLHYYVKQTGRQILFATHRGEVFGRVASQILRVRKIDGVAEAEVISHEQLLRDIEEAEAEAAQERIAETSGANGRNGANGASGMNGMNGAHGADRKVRRNGAKN